LRGAGNTCGLLACGVVVWMDLVCCIVVESSWMSQYKQKGTSRVAPLPLWPFLQQLQQG
jgi:hypothetical protein